MTTLQQQQQEDVQAMQQPLGSVAKLVASGIHLTERCPLILQQIRRASEDWGFFQVEFFCPWT
jgi:hypothetical protein